MRNLVIVFGDQLNQDSAAFTGFDKSCDRVWMAEVEEEATHVWCHKLRIAVFLAAMRHFRDTLTEQGFSLDYHELTTRRTQDRGKGFAAVLRKDLRRLRPERLFAVRPGDYRVLRLLTEVAENAGIELEIRPDNHFYCSVEEFMRFAGRSKSLPLESFYRLMRRQHEILVEKDGKPIGGQWNFDKNNRDSFGSSGPGTVPSPHTFAPDAVTRDVLRLVESRFRKHPGSLEHFDARAARDLQRCFAQYDAGRAFARFVQDALG